MPGMPDHAHLKLHPQFVLIDMYLHTRNQIYQKINVFEILKFKNPTI